MRGDVIYPAETARTLLLMKWDGAVEAYRDYALARELFLGDALTEPLLRYLHLQCVHRAIIWRRTARLWSILNQAATPAAVARGG